MNKILISFINFVSIFNLFCNQKSFAQSEIAGVFASINGMIEVCKLAFGYKPKLISRKTSECMLKPVILTQKVLRWNVDSPLDKEKLESHYALGWRVLKVKGSQKKDLTYHLGYIKGVKSFIGFIPSKELGIIILTNQESKFSSQNGIKFWKIASNDLNSVNLTVINKRVK